jgi:hypothetical protein
MKSIHIAVSQMWYGITEYLVYMVNNAKFML